MNSPNPTLLRAYGNQEVFFKKASGGARLADVLFEKLALNPTLASAAKPLSGIRMKTMNQAPISAAFQAPKPAAPTMVSGTVPKGQTQIGRAVAPTQSNPLVGTAPPRAAASAAPSAAPTPVASRMPSGGFDMDKLKNDAIAAGNIHDPNGPYAQARRQMNQGLQEKHQQMSQIGRLGGPPTSSAMKAPGQLGGDRAQTGALMGGPQKPGSNPPLVPPSQTSLQKAAPAPAAAGAQPVAKAPEAGGEEAPAASSKGGIPWNRLLLTGGLLGAGYLGLKGLQSGLNFLGGGHGGPAGYGYAPGGYMPPMGVNAYGAPMQGTPLM